MHYGISGCGSSTSIILSVWLLDTTLHSAHPKMYTMYNVHTVRTVSVHMLHCTLHNYTANCTQRTEHCTLYTAHILFLFLLLKVPHTEEQ